MPIVRLSDVHRTNASNITTSQIADLAITTNKLLITGKGAPLNDDPAMLDSTAWQTVGPVNYAGMIFASVPDATVGNRVARSAVGSPSSIIARHFPLNPNKTYRIRARVRPVGSNGGFHLIVSLQDSAGAYIARDSSYWYHAVSGITPTAGWTEYTALFGAGQGANAFPAEARLMAPAAILNYPGTTGYMEAQLLSIEEMVSTDLVLDGSLTALKIDSRGLSIKDSNGNVILAAGTALSNSTFAGDTVGTLNGISVSTVVSNAATALANATAAQTAAAAATTALTNIASDNILSPSEKPAAIQNYNVIIGEQAGIDTQATAYSITTEKTAYDSAVTALITYLSALTGWSTVPGTDVAIVGATFRTNFTNVYTAKQTLLNKISAVAGTIATWSSVTGAGKPADNATVGATWGVNVIGSAAVDAAVTAAQTSATAAQAAATSANNTANAANVALANIASDSILSPGEKPAVVQDYTVILAEQAGIDAQSIAYNITTEKTTYDTAITTLTTYLGTLTGWNTIPGGDVAIVGTTFRAKFSDVYTAKQAILNKISSVAGTLATWATVSGTGKPADNATVGATWGVNVTGSAAVDAAVATAQTAATNAQTAATAAQTSATTANTALTNIASDSILSPSEKPAVVQDYAVITGEQAGLDAQATAYAITTEKTAYDAAITTLTSYVGTLTGWNTIPGVDVAIVGTTFRTNFANVYTTKQTLVNKIAAIAGTLANWALVTGAGKPADNATVGATWGTNVTGSAAVDAAVAAAQSLASAAQISATAANTALTNIASDSILSPSEKPTVVQDYSVIISEQTGIDAQATAYAITTEKTAYDAAVTALTAYLSTLTGWNTVPGTDVVIVGTAFRTNFANVYTTKQTLLNKIAATAGTIALWTGVSGAGKPADNATVGATWGVNVTGSSIVDATIAAVSAAATTAQTAATNAQTTATAATTALTNIASDNILSPSEKPSVVQDYAVITGEQTGIDAQATAYAITTEKTAYDAAITALTTYLGTLTGWNTIPGVDVAIVGATFRANFANVYTAKQTLLNKISAIAGTLSNWAGVQGKPDTPGNLILKSSFEDGSFGTWTNVTVGTHTGTSWGKHLVSTVRDSLETGSKFPVIPGETFFVGADIVSNTDWTCGIGLRFLDVNGVDAGWAAGITVPAGTPGAFIRCNGSVVAPSTAVTAMPWLSINNASGTPPLLPHWFANLYIGRQQLGATVGATWGVNVTGSAAVDAAVAAAQASATAAQTTATAASTAAAAANTALTNIASDSILSPSEKPTVVQDYAVITGEQTGIDAQAASYGITTERTTYDNAVTALTTYLGTLTGWNTIPGSDVAIVGATFRANFQAVYTAKQALLNKISAIAGTLATWATVTGTGKPADNATVGATWGTNVTGSAAVDAAILAASNAATAASVAASSAQIAANTANTALATIASDSVLSTSEKFLVVQDYAVITGEQAGLDAQATAYAITTEKATYDTAVTALTTYLNGLTGWNVIPGTNVAIVGTTFRANFAAVYTAKQALLNKIAAVAGTLATWSSVTGTGKPADNATLGATWGVNVTGSAAVDAAVAAANTAATAAQNTANAVNTALINIASDSILSPSEKPSVVQDYNVIISEQAGIDAQATAYAITTEKTAYDTSVTALTTYLSTLTGFNTIPGVDIAIVGTTFRANFAAVYTAKQALVNKIAAVAGTIANWANITKPSNITALTGTEVINNAAFSAGSNVCPNCDFSNGLTDWAYGSSGIVGATGGPGFNQTALWTLNSGLMESSNTAFLQQIGGTTTASGAETGIMTLWSQGIPILGGKRWMVSAYTGAHRCKVSILFWFYDAAGTQLGYTNSTGVLAENNAEATGGQTLSQYKRIYNYVDTPVGAAYAVLELRKYNTLAGNTDSLGFFCRVQLEEVGAAATTPGPWNPAPSLKRTVTDIATANTAATAAQTAATAAQATATAANTAATAANTALTNIASDAILSPSEKPSVVQNYSVITGEQAGLDAQATAYGITTEKTAYDTAVTALTTYLGTLTGWNTVPGTDVAIVGATFRTNFANVYTAKQALLNKISAVAGTLATWATVSGTGKPADNATVGATIGTNLSGQITAANASTYIANGSLGTAHIGTLDASVITAFTITTDRLQVGSVTATASALLTSQTVVPFTGTLYNTVQGEFTLFSFTTTGKPILATVAGDLISFPWVTTRLDLTGSVRIRIYNGTTLVSEIGGYTDSFSISEGSGGSGTGSNGVGWSAIRTGIPAGTYTVKAYCLVTAMQLSGGFKTWPTNLLTRLDFYGECALVEIKV